MGCTSSAPNMPEILTNTTDTLENDNHIVRDETIQDNAEMQGITENELNDTNKHEVLPTCDSLEENIQLARNTNSFIKIDYEEQEHDKTFTRDVENDEIGNDEIENEEKSAQNKLSTVKEVADKIIVNNVLEDMDNDISILSEQKLNNDENDILDIDQITSSTNEHCNDEELEDAKGQQNIEKSASPSQSDGSRSTRWEALADIAAELPPSLAVDPVTGQIYSFTK